MGLVCIDCRADLVRRPGRGRTPLRCELCRTTVRKAYEHAYTRGEVPERICVGCKSGRPAFRRSYCATCAEKRAQRTTYTRKCWCGVEFTTNRPDQKFCNRSCSPWRSGRPKVKTTHRGYGYEHQKRRAALLPAAIGTDCPLCGVEMTEFDKLHADHVVPISKGGADGPLRIVHASCNSRRQAGRPVRHLAEAVAARVGPSSTGSAGSPGRGSASEGLPGVPVERTA